MGYVFKTELAHRSNFGSTRAYSAIKYIVMHYTANDGDRAENNAKYFQSAHKPATSAHYFVDNDMVVQSVPDNFVAYAVGGKKYTDCAATGGGTLYGKVTNANSISIEMCDTHRDGKYQATEQTMSNAAELCRRLMDKYGVGIDHVVRHFDVNGKHCPAYFMDSAAWERFKDRLRTCQFEAGKVYTATRSCYLRRSAGAKDNKVKHKTLPDSVKKKCRNKLGWAVLKKNRAFRLVRCAYSGGNIWGKIKTGYWVPLIYKGETRAK